MRMLSSLRGRIFLASAGLAVLSIGTAIYLVNVRVTREAEQTLQREIVATSALVDQLGKTRTQAFTQMARLIADAPKMKAAVDTNDPPTVQDEVQDVASSYQDQLESNLLVVTNMSGAVLARVGGSAEAGRVVASQPAVRGALRGHEGFSLLPQPDGILEVVTIPISIDLQRPGTLSVGFLLDNALAAQLRGITGSDVAFGMDGRVLAGTLPREMFGLLGGRLRTTGTSLLSVDGDDYLVLPRPLTGAGGAAAADGPVALIVRSRTEQLRGLQAIHTELAATAVVAVLVATILGFAVARTITRPLANITDVMREVASTGDLTRKIAVGPPSRWDDEDARLLATTFNTLTDSIARFQREMSQKERLTSLGRLSTVIAHEIRNPLMIIKAALHGLRQAEPTAAALREAVADIDEEVGRLNRIVNEVLDFSRPIRFDLAPVDVALLCRESAAAAQASPGVPVVLDLEPGLPVITADAERLRLALVNMLVNARHAVRGGGEAAGAPPVTLRAAARQNGVTMTIADRGVGIAPDDLPRIFDPYFTTRRGGTGLGLAIAKNIVEGLGGTIAVSSVTGRGTEIRIDLPASPARAAGAA
jgi:two-component system, NtrC family, nitrogen regulation sensor histidine kinase NtrY